jgi:hypothetical protein
LHIPLLVSQQLLDLAACMILIAAIRPLFNNYVLIVIFLAFAWNPYSYSDAVVDRVIRDFVCFSLALIILACVLAIYIRLHGKKKPIVCWSILMGLALSAFYLSREDSEWILPLVVAACLIEAAVLLAGRKKTKDWVGGIIIIIIPFLILVLSNTAVALTNKIYYGEFVTTGTTSSNFLGAYDALTRVKSNDWKPDVPVSNEAIEEIYKVSPAFAKLKPYLDGQLCQWARRSPDNEFDGGHFM